MFFIADTSLYRVESESWRVFGQIVYNGQMTLHLKNHLAAKQLSVKQYSVNKSSVKSSFDQIIKLFGGLSFGKITSNEMNRISDEPCVFH
jgi:hypothetical protein